MALRSLSLFPPQPLHHPPTLCTANALWLLFAPSLHRRVEYSTLAIPMPASCRNSSGLCRVLPPRSLTFSMLYLDRACDAQSTASCCMSSDMSAFLITAFLCSVMVVSLFAACRSARCLLPVRVVSLSVRKAGTRHDPRSHDVTEIIFQADSIRRKWLGLVVILESSLQKVMYELVDL